MVGTSKLLVHTESLRDGIGLVLFPQSYSMVDRTVIPAWQVQPEPQQQSNNIT